MQRRPVILDPRFRRAAIVAAVVASLLAAISCLVRVSYLSESSTPVGQPRVHDLTLARGVFRIESSTWPLGGRITSPLGWKASIHPGFDPTVFRHSTHFAPPGAGVAGPVFEQRTYGIAAALLSAAAVCVVLVLPLLPVPPGECVCGYRLEGLGSGHCPECGRPHPAGTGP